MIRNRKNGLTPVTVSRDEARDFYLEIFGSFAVVVYDKGDKQRGERTIDNRAKEPVVEAINQRFAACDATDQTIVRDWVNKDYEVWQCWRTYDDWSEEQAEAAFDEAWPTDLIEVTLGAAKRQSTTVPSAECRCGCGEQASGGKGYRPGHDARHAGTVARAILALPAGPKAKAETIRLIDTLPTEALRNKALAQVERGNAKNQGGKATTKVALRKPTTDPAEGEVQDGYVTVNGKTVPAQRFMIDGEIRLNINDAEDGSGDWLDSEGYNRKSQAYWLKRFYVAKV